MELVLIKSLARLGAATKKIPFLARKMLTFLCYLTRLGGILVFYPEDFYTYNIYTKYI